MSSRRDEMKYVLNMGRRSESVDEATFEHGNEYLMYMLALVSDLVVVVVVGVDHFESKSWMFSIAIVNMCSMRPPRPHFYSHKYRIYF